MHSRVFNLNSIDCLRSGLLINLSGFSFTGTEILGSAKLTFFIIFEKQSIKKRFCSLFSILPITSSKRVNCRIVLEENQRLILSVSKVISFLLLLALVTIELRVVCNTSEGIYVVFTCDISTANGFASAPSAFLPDIFASSITVPVPQNGSSTIPFWGQK